MTPDEAAKRLERLGDGLETAAREAVNRTLEVGLAEARNLSSGGMDRTELRRRGHPYARRHGRIQSPGNPFLVNLQDGDFYEGWLIESTLGPDPSGVLYNQDPKAEWLEKGTRLMLGRDLPERLEEKLLPRLESELDAALARLM
jgi:hypothetical protein